MIKNYVLGMAALLMLSGLVSAQKVAGAWQLTEVKTTGEKAATEKTTQPNLYLFTKGHYSIIRVDSDAARPTDDPAKMTAEQLLQTYVRDFVANGGTYEMKGDTLTMKIMVAKSPLFMTPGHWISFDVKFMGNQMWLTTKATDTGPAKNPATYTLTRVE